MGKATATRPAAIRQGYPGAPPQPGAPQQPQQPYGALQQPYGAPQGMQGMPGAMAAPRGNSFGQAQSALAGAGGMMKAMKYGRLVNYNPEIQALVEVHHPQLGPYQTQTTQDIGS